MLRLLPVALLAACIFTNQVPCTDMAASSVTVSVVGPDGSPLVAELTAHDEDGNEVSVECATGAADDACTEWIVGWEVDGEITIEAEAYDGCNTGTGVVVVDVPMDEDGCHVVPQTATLHVDEWTDLDCG